MGALKPDIKKLIIIISVANLIAFIIESLVKFLNIHSLLLFFSIQLIAIAIAVVIVGKQSLTNYILLAFILAIVRHLTSLYAIDLLTFNKAMYLTNLSNTFHNIVFNIFVVILIYIIQRNIIKGLVQRTTPKILRISAIALLITSVIPFTVSKLLNLSWALNIETDIMSFSFQSALISLSVLAGIWFISLIICNYLFNESASLDGFIYSFLLAIPLITNYLNVRFLNLQSAQQLAIVSKITTFTLLFFLALAIVLTTITFLTNTFNKRAHS